MKCAATSRAGAENLATGSFGCKFFGFKSSDNSGISTAGIIHERVIDLGNSFKT